MSYFDSIMLHGSGIIQIQCPNAANADAMPDAYTDLVTGIMQDDPQIQMGNTFTTLSELADALKDLQDTQMVLGGNNLVNYIPASAMLWQGTAPIVLNASFYLVTIHKASNIQKKLQGLASLATLYTSEDSKHGMNARIHGGYKYMYYNTQTTNLINNAGIAKNKDVPGTCRIYLNDSTRLDGMLLTSLQFQPSTVVCPKGEPLYYLVNASFTQYRPPVTTDLNHVFGGK